MAVIIWTLVILGCQKSWIRVQFWDLSNWSCWEVWGVVKKALVCPLLSAKSSVDADSQMCTDTKEKQAESLCPPPAW